MSKAKKLALSALAALALLVGGNAAYQHHHAGQPYLVGHCFVDPMQGVGLAVADAQMLKDEKKQDVLAYLTVLILNSPMGQISLNGPALEVREANKELAKAVREGKLEEVNCETGEPISK